MKNADTAVILSVVLGIAGLTGCGSKMSKVAQGLTPIAANFYVLHQELDRARQGVKAEVPAQVDAHMSSYDEVAGQLQTMGRDVAADPELQKKQALKAAIDSCLAADLVFIGLEVRAVKLQAAAARLDLQIKDINQRNRGNSFKLRQAQAELDRLSHERSRDRQDLDKLLLELAPAAGRCRDMLKQYDFIVVAEKIVNYSSNESMYDLFGWEKVKTEHHRPAAKPRPAKKAHKRR